MDESFSVKKKKSARKTIIILCSVFAVIVAIVAVVAVWQWNNINALRLYLSSSREEIGAMLEENEKAVSNIASKMDVSVGELTDEEQRKLASGELSVEDAVQIILNKPAQNESGEEQQTTGIAVDSSDNTTAESDGGTTVKTTEKINQASPPKKEPSSIDALVAEIYALRSYYSGTLEGMRQAAVSEYAASGGSKKDIGLRYLKQAGALESECDSKMDSLVSKLETALCGTGGDLSIIGEVVNAYADEKSLKKAYYLNLYE